MWYYKVTSYHISIALDAFAYKKFPSRNGNKSIKTRHLELVFY